MGTIPRALCLVLAGVLYAIAAPKGFGTAQRAIVIGCDGFGGLYLENYTRFLPTFRRLAQDGSATYRARNQIPTVSAPNWATIITGQTPVDSGIFDNNWLPKDTNPENMSSIGVPPVSGAGRIPETMWSVAKQQWKQQGRSGTVGVSTAWDWIRYLAEPPAVDFLFRGQEDDEAVTTEIIKMIRTVQPDLMFVHLDDIDETGHRHGWGGPEYVQAARNTDRRVGDILAALKDAKLLADTLVVITADHGGWGYGHGQNTQACVYIPLIFYGAGISPKCNINGTVARNADIAPTVLNALGLQRGRFMSGRTLDALYC